MGVQNRSVNSTSRFRFRATSILRMIRVRIYVLVFGRHVLLWDRDHAVIRQYMECLYGTELVVVLDNIYAMNRTS